MRSRWHGSGVGRLQGAATGAVCAPLRLPSQSPHAQASRSSAPHHHPCRALKTKHETPKYGLIYHASLVGQAPAKLKGKISRVLAAKAALGVRCDALCDVNDEGAMGIEARAKVSPFSPDEPSFLPPAAGRPL